MKNIFSWLIVLSILAMVLFNIFTVMDSINIHIFYIITISILFIALVGLIVVLIKERLKEKEEEKDVIGKY
ncbi:hypothetical protein GOQ27_01580 [Clostridium sp. D2Q-11]|uniref:Uncharacterized protein n=1 Tax=Anaeromonas frigoriresistens TaxID=2683708 RepID=A0A942UWY1_9FIRM|nr:hypothetical protein [Anaeromonas frigoriresistens]MBS4537132.1 hypothetical protein [Anaeromonas frigoriresistens]